MWISFHLIEKHRPIFSVRQVIFITPCMENQAISRSEENIGSKTWVRTAIVGT